MVNALFSSRAGGTKDFQFGGASFGWKAIEDMYARDCTRRTSGAARMVPKMKEAYILHDSWTKLNVAPAKIMQVRIFIYGRLKIAVLICIHRSLSYCVNTHILVTRVYCNNSVATCPHSCTPHTCAHTLMHARMRAHTHAHAHAHTHTHTHTHTVARAGAYRAISLCKSKSPSL